VRERLRDGEKEVRGQRSEVRDRTCLLVSFQKYWKGQSRQGSEVGRDSCFVGSWKYRISRRWKVLRERQIGVKLSSGSNLPAIMQADRFNSIVI